MATNKRIILSESDLAKIIQKTITKKLNEGNFSVEPEVSIIPREKQVAKVFGKYSGYLPDDLLRYIRKNPSLIVQRLLDIYGDSLIRYVENAVKNKNRQTISKEMNEQSELESDFEEEIKYPVDNFDFKLDDSDIDEIYDDKKPKRRFRGSIYVDGIVPETDDKEYDRKLAIKILENFADKLPTKEYYIGGVGFKQRSFTEPYDNMDF
jgi:hypothetical protein